MEIVLEIIQLQIFTLVYFGIICLMKFSTRLFIAYILCVDSENNIDNDNGNTNTKNELNWHEL